MIRQEEGNNKGFTVIEFAIVLAIIAIMALVMTPALGEWATRFRIKGATRELADTFQLARLKAVSNRVQYKVQLDLDSRAFVLQKGPSWDREGSVITLPRGVEINNVDGTTSGTVDRTFRTDGSATGFAGTTSIIYLQNDRNDQFQVIISQTGCVRVSGG